jgi:hypothetical protein
MPDAGLQPIAKSRGQASAASTIRELRDREIVLRSLREGIDTSNSTGRIVAGALACLAELELELNSNWNWPGTSGGSARSASGVRAKHRAAKGARQAQSRSGAADARERRIGKHHRGHAGCEPRNGVPGLTERAEH